MKKSEIQQDIIYRRHMADGTNYRLVLAIDPESDMVYYNELKFIETPFNLLKLKGWFSSYAVGNERICSLKAFAAWADYIDIVANQAQFFMLTPLSRIKELSNEDE